jgi:hypothetical protein
MDGYNVGKGYTVSSSYVLYANKIRLNGIGFLRFAHT